ncbi:type II secretion system protein [Uliginosibacterium sediminicola]|uniref:Prepilin-type N-terminal cleavage/methylation domain-containing protein n=1 Tax=Uliginosibacterium sediminicola TaxID=2024550 RepID=A0ABU9Z0G3_9RHOO
MRQRSGLTRRQAAFTMIEMLIVMAIIALLLTLALPKYFKGVDSSKEVVLLDNLHTTRELIDKFYSDQGRYPESLEELVERKYLRSLPIDPVTGSSRTWVLIPPEPPYKGQVYDIKSGARGATRDGRPFGSL